MLTVFVSLIIRDLNATFASDRTDSGLLENADGAPEVALTMEGNPYALDCEPDATIC